MTATWTVLQAEARGVTGTRPDGSGYLARGLDTEAPGGWTRLVRPPAGVEPSRTLEFGRLQVGDRYGFLTIASIVFTLIPPRWLRWPITFRTNRTWICSALAAEALRFGGWLADWPDLYQVTPAELMRVLLATGGREITLAEAQAGDAGFAHGTGFTDRAIRLGQRLNREDDWQVNHVFLLDRRLA